MEVELRHIEVKKRWSVDSPITGSLSEEVWLPVSFKERAHASSVEGYFDLSSPTSIDTPESPEAEAALPTEEVESLPPHFVEAPPARQAEPPPARRTSATAT